MNEVGKTSLNNFNNPFRYILFTDIIIQKRVSSVWIVKTLKKKKDYYELHTRQCYFRIYGFETRIFFGQFYIYWLIARLGLYIIYFLFLNIVHKLVQFTLSSASISSLIVVCIMSSVCLVIDLNYCQKEMV